MNKEQLFWWSIRLEHWDWMLWADKYPKCAKYVVGRCEAEMVNQGINPRPFPFTAEERTT